MDNNSPTEDAVSLECFPQMLNRLRRRWVNRSCPTAQTIMVHRAKECDTASQSFQVQPLHPFTAVVLNQWPGMVSS